jgi:hypothetical protein
VADAKLGYVKASKSGSIIRAGLEDITADQLAALIRSKISASYIYSMSFNETHNVAKFNVIIELPRPGNGGQLRLLAAMEYKPDGKTLRLITLY